MRIILTRHGATEGTEVKRYSGGGSDEPLSEAGVAALRALPPRRYTKTVYTSGMVRTDQTARILYPQASIERVAELREMDFGLFEGKTFQELEGNEAYRVWVEGMCEGRCPEGEDRASFIRRSCQAFLSIVERASMQNENELHFVVHGGNIMALISEFSNPPRDYFSIRTAPGASWVVEMSKEEFHVVAEPGDLDVFHEGGSRALIERASEGHAPESAVEEVSEERPC